MAELRVAVEAGAKRVFAIALDWPGWARAARDEEDALAALMAYGARYSAAVGDPLPAETGLTANLVERLAGGSGTDFGVPGAEAQLDRADLDEAELDRQLRLLRGAWTAFDAAAGAAVGHALRTGPRGGGRDLGKMTAHVREAEEAYLTQLGARRPKPAASDPVARMRQVREAAAAALVARAAGRDPADPSRVRRRWPPRYHIRRSAWHALDHAWELEDRLVA